MFEWALFFITFAVLYHWLNLKPKDFPPGPPTIPLLGSLPFIKSSNFHLEVEKLREKYGPIIGLKIGLYPAATICGPAEVIEVLKRDDFTARPSLTLNLRKAEGVMFSSGQPWKEQRRFVLRHLRDFGFGKNSVADMVRDEVEEFCTRKLQGKTNIEATRLFNTSAINILWAMIAGSRLSYDDKNFHHLLDALERLFRQGNVLGGIVNGVPGLRKLISLVHEMDDDRTDRILRDFFKKTFEEHRKTMTEKPRDFLDVYLTELEDPNKKASFAEDVLLEICRDLFAAGTESSSNTLSFAIMYLVRHPEWQDKLLEEIDQILCGEVPTIEDRQRLPLVEAFLTEVQRSNTIAPFTVPHATTKDTYLNGYFLPRDTFVQVSIWSLLQDKKHWGDPETFRPERFLTSDGAFIKDPYMLLFGAGPRICLGESLARNFVFLFFVSLLQRYKFKLPKGAQLPSTVCKPGFTTAPQPFCVDLEARK